jgi:hypothetical protein
VLEPDLRPGAEGDLARRAATVARTWEELGSGRGVPARDRSPYEASFGQSLAHARVHDDAVAGRLTDALGVKAFTAGDHVVLGAGRYGEALSGGILGHELAHVAQQDRGRAPAGGVARFSEPGSALERNADEAAALARRGRPAHVQPADGRDVMGFPWLLALAALAFVGAATTAAVSPSYEENQQAAAADRDRFINTNWVYVPLVGSFGRIIQARSPLERWFNVAMAPLDVLTLGAAGGALLRIGGIAWRAAIRDAAAREVVNLAVTGVRATSAAEVNAAVRTALDGGQAVVATVGWRNHMVVFVRVGDRYYKLSGGITTAMHRTAYTAAEFAPRVNAFSAVGPVGGDVGAQLLAQAQGIGGFYGVGFSARSCSLTSSVLLERVGMGHLVPATAGGRFLPVTVMGSVAEGTGSFVTSAVGMQRFAVGTTMNFAVMGVLHTGTHLRNDHGEWLAAQGYGAYQGVRQLVRPPSPAPTSRAPNQSRQGEGGPVSAPDGSTLLEEVSLDQVMAQVDSPAGPAFPLDVIPAGLRAAGVGPAAETDAGAAPDAAAAGPEIVMIPIVEPPGGHAPEPEPPPERVVPPGEGRAEEPRAPEPALVAGARRLRDRYLAAPPEQREAILADAHSAFPFSFSDAAHVERAAYALLGAGFSPTEVERALVSLREPVPAG